MTPWGSQEVAQLGVQRTRAEIDGVGAFMNRVYMTMAAGLAVTGVVALAVSSNQAVMMRVMSLMWPLIIGQLLMVFAITPVARKLGALAATGVFLFYALLNGLTLSVIFLVYTSASITTMFFVTAGAFAGLSAFGFATKKDLSGVGRFMYMGLIGLVIASVVNIFLKNSAMDWVISCVGVLVFTGLTAWDTQKLKNLYFSSEKRSLASLAVIGALTLYLDFVNLFLFLLRLFGDRK